MKNSSETNKTLCPVCGKSHVEEYDICEICNWENDPVQVRKPDFSGGANKMSLNQARKAYQAGQPIQ